MQNKRKKEKFLRISLLSSEKVILLQEEGTHMNTRYLGKPFVKWVGGKSQLISDLEKQLPRDFGSWKDAVYIEPFVGGGAMLFWMLQTFPNIKKAYINDINRELITTYKVVRNSPKPLLSFLETLQGEYISLGEKERKEYYLLKRKRFNNGSLSDVEVAALLIFLNRTCFNGLYRVNSKGEFNVPHGRYKNPKICDEATIMADSALLQKVEITHGDFSDTLKNVTDNCFYYLDPPYKPLSETSSFNSYSKEAFGDSEQIRLCQYCKDLERFGAHFILSNSDVKGKDSSNNFFDDLYGSFYVKRVLASRMVNANPQKRGKLTELMVSNF